LSSDDVYDWLSSHPNCDIKLRDVMIEISEALLLSKMNDNKIHIKVESLVKSAAKTFENYEE